MFNKSANLKMKFISNSFTIAIFLDSLGIQNATSKTNLYLGKDILLAGWDDTKNMLSSNILRIVGNYFSIAGKLLLCGDFN